MVLETKYGQFKITGIRLRTILDTVIMLNEKSFTTFSKDQFYNITKSALSSHGPIDKLVDMGRFGLLEKTEHFTFEITPLGEEFLKSSGEERSKIIERIFRNIPLWNELFDTIGKNPSIETFSSKVREITQASPELIDRNLARLYSAYNGDIECINKTPPYGVMSPLIGRTKLSRDTRKIIHNENRIIPLSNNEPDNTPPDTTIKMSITYGSRDIPIVDELSYRFAEQVMVMIRKELARRGVRLG